MGTRHSEATKKNSIMGRQEAGGMIKQTKKTAQVIKNAEVSVGRNPIARFFGRKELKRSLGRPRTIKK